MLSSMSVIMQQRGSPDYSGRPRLQTVPSGALDYRDRNSAGNENGGPRMTGPPFPSPLARIPHHRLLQVVGPQRRPLVHPILRAGRGFGPIGEVLLAAPRLVDTVQLAAPGFPILGEQALQLVVTRLAGQPWVCHASLLVGPRALLPRVMARRVPSWGRARQPPWCYKDRRSAAAVPSAPQPPQDGQGAAA